MRGRNEPLGWVTEDARHHRRLKSGKGPLPLHAQGVQGVRLSYYVRQRSGQSADMKQRQVLGWVAELKCMLRADRLKMEQCAYEQFQRDNCRCCIRHRYVLCANGHFRLTQDVNWSTQCKCKLWLKRPRTSRLQQCFSAKLSARALWSWLRPSSKCGEVI